MATQSPVQFGRVLEQGSRDRRTWTLVIAIVAGLVVLLGFAVYSTSRASSLETQARLAAEQARELQKAVDERDRLLASARADENLLRAPGQGAALLEAARPGGSASGVALLHPEAHAMSLYLYGLPPAPAGYEYRASVATDGRPQILAERVNADERGGAFVLAKTVPEGAKSVQVTLERKDEGPAQPGLAEGQVVLAAELPGAGRSGVAEGAGARRARAPGATPRRRSAAAARPVAPPAPQPKEPEAEGGPGLAPEPGR